MTTGEFVYLLRSQIHEYGNIRNGWNGHRMFITIEHRNLGIRKHVTTSCSGTKPFYQLWVKGFDVRRRDTIFSAVLFSLPPSRVALIGRKFALRLRPPKVDPSRLVSSTQLSNFFRFSQKLRALLVCDVTRTLSPRFVSDYYDIWVTPPSASAPALTPASMLHPTNPCAEPKGSQPN